MAKRSLAATHSSSNLTNTHNTHIDNIDASPPPKRSTRSSARLAEQTSPSIDQSSSFSSNTRSKGKSPRTYRPGSTPAASSSTSKRALSVITISDSTPEPDIDELDFPELPSDEEADMAVAIAASMEENYPKPPFRTTGLPSPAPTNEFATQGRKAWKNDSSVYKQKYKTQGEVEGYAGMVAILSKFDYGDADDSVKFHISYEDLDGRQLELSLQLAFQNLMRYPSIYNVVVYAESETPRRAQTTFSRFTDIYELDLASLFGQLIASLQGDDDANGGFPADLDDVEYDEMEETDPWADTEGPVVDQSKRSKLDFDDALPLLRKHFAQAKSLGYRPGFTSVSDYWVISYSIPLKNLPIDPTTLAIWDDGLVAAWKTDQRLHLLMGVDEYPPHVDKIKYWLGFHKDYKPPHDVIVATTRRQGLPRFFLSSSILSYLKSFGRCFKARTAFNVNWITADQIGLDEERSRQVFSGAETPLATDDAEKDDPVSKGMENNVLLCAFHWALRRFVEAPKHCMNCGLEVSTPSLRPYVCDKPLCLYSFMSLGLGPSVEHTITTHPAVVDILLSFAYCAASTQARMDLLLHLHIEVPPECNGTTEVVLLDELEAQPQRSAIAWLIKKLPRVSEIKEHLDGGRKLKDIDAPSGSIGVLRWVIGSCRAYLKETQPGEGVVNDQSPINAVSYGITSSAIKQFSFVVGSPEQESNFKLEIEAAQARDTNVVKYPTLLAYHGSATERWHSILRTGLDYNEVTNGRAYGNGVYFASEVSTSMSGYARSSQLTRDNADFPLEKATAVVELVNVPNTFVSSNPFYVVGNVKQIKPFLLLVQVRPEASVAQAVQVPPRGDSSVANDVTSLSGELFNHDPNLRIKTTYFQQPLQARMPMKLIGTTYVDDEPDDPQDAIITNVTGMKEFKPSPACRFVKLQLMPPPTETSVVASRALAKEFKTLVKLQTEGKLPFYLDPETDSLYCWTLELFEFPESQLKKDMTKFNLKSLIAEIRFPATFPHSPPFMRILHPRFLPFSQGGGGNITAGGSICNEILTSTGWNPAFCVEAIVRDIMTNMTEATPPAKLDPRRWDQSYTLYEAVDAFKRVAAVHGWQVPKDFDKLSR